jgi:hypothetical protein
MKQIKGNTADIAAMNTTADGLKKPYGQPVTAGAFKIGHPRVGGRKPGSPNRRTKQALEICEELSFHPAAFLATIALTGLMPNPDGSTTPVTTDDRLRAATALAPFVMPRLQATQVTGKDDGPLAVATLDMSRILADPALVEQAQNIALALADADRCPAPAQRVLPPGDTYPER